MSVALVVLAWTVAVVAPLYALIGVALLIAKIDELKARAVRTNAEAIATDRASRLASPPTIRAVD